LSVDPEAGDAMVGSTCIERASAVISANNVDVKSHMIVFNVVVFNCVFGGTNIAS
jgi:hypothetical protein